MQKDHNKPIRRRVLIPLSLTFAVLFATFAHIAYQIRADQNLSDFRHRYQVTQSYTNVASTQRQALMQQLLREIAEDPQLVQAMQADDRAALYQLALPLQYRLKETQGINHLYFHKPDGTTFLRVYNPETFGDKIERGTFLKTIQTQKFSYGLELGQSGTLTYRSVIPWRIKGELLGYIEIGMELNQVLSQLQSIVKEDFLVTLNKSNLERTRWENGRERFGRAQNWNLLPDRVVAYQTMADFSTLDQSHLLSKISTKDNDYFELVIDQHDYRVKGFPLIDFNGSTVGTILVMHNISPENKQFKQLVTPTILAGGGFCLILFIFAYNVLGRMDRQLLITRRQLNDEVANVRTSNIQLEAEIKQRISAEKELKLLNETLEMRVIQRTAALEELNQQLKDNQAKILHQDKMACIGQVAAGVAHDINNPVGFVSHNLLIFQRYLQRLEQFVALQEELIKARGNNDLLTGWEKGRRDFKIDAIFQELPEMLEECRDGTTRITQIVQGLRTFSRVDTPQHQLTDLHQCIDSTLSLLRHEFQDRIKIFRDYGEIPRRYCYTEQMSQVFMNLLINAAQASAAQGEIHIRTWTENRKIFITIRDNGCGIPEEQLAQIFEPFFTTKPVRVGTGLGLSIVYDIVTRHQGEISVSSTVGAGTTFTVQFPLDPGTKPCKVNPLAGEENSAPEGKQGDQHG
ncbi:MAG: GHKL domain-containing protein [Desulfuromonadales bacterium]|nr:GHKL domain-containing protein [Desulfuromonadales bacterium]